jgi:hypothetical protein
MRAAAPGSTGLSNGSACPLVFSFSISSCLLRCCPIVPRTAAWQATCHFGLCSPVDQPGSRLRASLLSLTVTITDAPSRRRSRAACRAERSRERVRGRTDGADGRKDGRMDGTELGWVRTPPMDGLERPVQSSSCTIHPRGRRRTTWACERERRRGRAAAETSSRSTSLSSRSYPSSSVCVRVARALDARRADQLSAACRAPALTDKS